MKNANVGSKKTFKTSESRCTAGMPVRSGVKAGLTHRQAEKIHAHKILDEREGNRF